MLAWAIGTVVYDAWLKRTGAGNDQRIPWSSSRSCGAHPGRHVFPSQRKGTVVTNMLERAGWTALQAFLAVFVVGDLATVEVALVAGVAAGLSVVKTFAQSRIKLSDA